VPKIAISLFGSDQWQIAIGCQPCAPMKKKLIFKLRYQFDDPVEGCLNSFAYCLSVCLSVCLSFSLPACQAIGSS